MKKGRVFFLILSVLIGTASHSYPAVITFDLAEVFSGDTPSGTTPWLTATFLDIMPPANSNYNSAVQLTLDAANLTGGSQFISQFFFNIDPQFLLTNPAPDFNRVSGAVASDTVNTNGIQAGTDGSFNIKFAFAANPGNGFQGGSSVIYDILSTGMISANSFDLANSSGFFSIANVLGTPSGAGSSWIVASQASAPGTPVPEPSTMLLLGIGLTCVAFFGRKRF
jgi:hypothetical protein